MTWSGGSRCIAPRFRFTTGYQPPGLWPDTKLMNMLRSAVAANVGEDGWAALGGVGTHILNQGSFDCRNYGFGKLSDLFNAIDCFELRRETNVSGGAVCSVRRRPKKLAN